MVLAAGLSRRFGDDPPKQLAPFPSGAEGNSEPLVRRAVRCALASEAAGVVVVLGHRRREVEAALAGLPVAFAVNSDPAAGLGTSVAAGAAALPAEAEAAFFLPCDQPLLTPAVLEHLLAAFRRRRGEPGAPPPIVVPAAPASCGAPRRGSPVTFDAAYFPALRALSGRRGGREVMARHPDAVVEVELADDLALRDADTPARLAELATIFRPSVPR